MILASKMKTRGKKGAKTVLLDTIEMQLVWQRRIRTQNDYWVFEAVETAPLREGIKPREEGGNA